MTESEVLKYLKKNPGFSSSTVARKLNVNRSKIESIAKSNGIEFPKSAREIVCSNVPESCFSCPFRDCKNGEKMKKAETKFVENAIGRNKIYGERRKKGTKNDK